MRQKRNFKTKKYAEEDNTPLYQPKDKKIKKKTNKLKNDQQQPDNDQPSCINQPRQEDNERDIRSTSQKLDSQNQEQQEMKNQEKELKKTQRQKNQQNSLVSISKLQNLAKLNQNLERIRNIHEEYLNKYKQYKTQCEQLSLRVIQSGSNVLKKAQQVIELSKSIYFQKSRIYKQQFLLADTFINSSNFYKFLENLANVAETLEKCPYEQCLDFIELTKIDPNNIMRPQKITVRQHRKQKVIKNYFIDFPYITTKQQNIPLIRALIGSTKYMQNCNKPPLMQFPCLFIRKSYFNFSMIQKIRNILFNFIFSDTIQFAQQIMKLCKQQCILHEMYSQSRINELLCKGLDNMRLICLPQLLFELRGFSFGGYLYINTYYVEKDTSLTKECCLAYCLLTGIRELVNYVYNSLFYSLNRSQQDIGKTIAQNRQRTDPGSKYETLITRQQTGFVCCSNQDIKILEELSVQKFHLLGKNNTIYENGYIFQQERNRKELLTKNILSKYEQQSKINDLNEAVQQQAQGCSDNNIPINQKIKANRSPNSSSNSNNDRLNQFRQSEQNLCPQYLNQIDPITGEKLEAINYG